MSEGTTCLELDSINNDNQNDNKESPNPNGSVKFNGWSISSRSVVRELKGKAKKFGENKTNHSLNSKMQNEWNLRILQELKSMENYSSPYVTVHVRN